ncbi:hypothetical protein GCM10010106_05430 [Thermopolyspora flexuosa]|uniref:ABC transporter permease n=1 Tax=Thermopolyspora flexuosa TaxID=103836 RepID=UPI00166E4E7D|nr:ABC transporter permease [Thermopolyspora flexuosa]GGM62291.1 hypothetical protein GCM10010106_05430 [Thermopolyspora flexuosa]
MARPGSGSPARNYVTSAPARQIRTPSHEGSTAPRQGRRRGEAEAAPALGLLPRAAALEICRPAAAQALVPALDQTRTVGLVALPGAFVGVLLGGASPLEAGPVRLVVPISLLAAEAVAVPATVELAARGRFGTARAR